MPNMIRITPQKARSPKERSLDEYEKKYLARKKRAKEFHKANKKLMFLRRN